MASGLLESEGFTDVQYVKVENSVAGDKALASGEVDLGLATALAGVMRIDAGDPRVLLSGVHVGCFELFGTERVRSVRDLKGKTVAVPAKARAVCAIEPQRAAQVLVDREYPTTYDLALQTLKEIPFGKWRMLDPENTVRFFALRLREAGMIKSTPQQIIANGTDWRILNELKKELKG